MRRHFGRLSFLAVLLSVGLLVGGCKNGSSSKTPYREDVGGVVRAVPMPPGSDTAQTVSYTMQPVSAVDTSGTTGGSW